MDTLTINEIVAIVDGGLAVIAVATSLWAAWRHPVKRWLWLGTTFIMVYLAVLSYQIVVGPGSSFFLGTLLRPIIGLIFVLFISHALVDSRER